MKVILLEQIWLPAWCERVQAVTEAKATAEDVESYGLSSTEYLAVVEADLGFAGKVNANGRIYPSSRFAIENVKLDEKAKTGWVPMEDGHPKGAPTHNVAARMIAVEVVTAEGETLTYESRADGTFAFTEAIPGVVKAKGKIAFLRTTQGENLWCQYRAGAPLGTSSRSYGIPVPHKLDEKSPYLADNPDHIGRTIDIIEGQELVTYDVVTDPSAGTYVTGNEGVAALPTTESNETPRGGEEKTTMHEWLKKNAPDFLAAIAAFPPEKRKLAEAKIAEAKDFGDLASLLLEGDGETAPAQPAPADPFVEAIAKMGAEERKRLQALVGIVEGTGTEKGGDDALIERVRTMYEAQLAPLTARLEALDKQAKAAVEEKAALARKLDEMKAEQARRDNLDAMATKLVESLEGVHSNLRENVKAFIQAEIERGAITKPEDVAEGVTRVSDLLTKVSEATATAPTTQAGDDAPITPPDADGAGDETEAVNEHALPADFAAALKKALGRG